MPAASPVEVPQVAARQGGVFTAEQAVEEGWTSRQVRRRLTGGQWRRVAGGCLTADPDPLPPLGRAWSAALRWPEAVCIHRTAAVLWHLPVPDDGLLHLCGPVGRRARGVRVHAVPIPEADVIVLGGGPRVTTLRRTMLDCLARLEFTEALDLYAWASSREHLSRSDVTAALRDRFGRAGARQLRRLLDVTASGAVSGAEHRLHTLMLRAGLTGWEAGVRLFDDRGRIGVVDVLFVAARLVIEVDGEAAHGGRSAFIRDRRRQNRLVNAGYRVLRFTWWDLTERPAAVVQEIIDALGAEHRGSPRIRRF
jgi:very-short-patch-repair endonuclease